MTRPQKNSARDADSLPPFDANLEASVLGSILLGAASAMDGCLEVGVTAQWFYDPRHQLLFSAALELHKSGKPVDTVSLAEFLTRQQLFEQAGGFDYLSKLPDRSPGASMLGYYLETLHGYALRRRILTVCAEGALAARDGRVPATDQVMTLERQAIGLAEEGLNDRTTPLAAVVDPVLARMRDYHRGHEQSTGILTGWRYLDKVLGGLGGDDNNMIVIAGRPSTGKTSLVLDVATYAALDFWWWTPKRDDAGQVRLKPDGKPETDAHQGVPVAIFSMEMSARALLQRMIFQRSGGNLQQWRTGFASAEDMAAVERGAAELKTAPIWIDDTPRMSIGELRAKARRLHRTEGVRLFVVDYVQLLRYDARRWSEDRVRELTEISGELQALGKELNVPLLICAQMNRDYEKDPLRRPRLSDLKDCGAFEQDADIVAFLYEPRLPAKMQEQHATALARAELEHKRKKGKESKDWVKPKPISVLVAKSRYGPSGKVAYLLFQTASTHFVDYYAWLEKAVGPSYEKHNPDQDDPPGDDADTPSHLSGGDQQQDIPL